MRTIIKLAKLWHYPVVCYKIFCRFIVLLATLFLLRYLVWENTLYAAFRTWSDILLIFLMQHFFSPNFPPQLFTVIVCIMWLENIQTTLNTQQKNLNTSSGLENVKTTGAAQSLVSQCRLLWFVNPKSEWNVKYTKAKTLNTLLKCEAFWKALKKTLKCIWPEKGIILSEALQLLFQVWNLCNLSLNGLHDGDVLLLEGETSLQLLPKCEERNQPKEMNRMCLSSALHKHSAILAVF